MENTVNPGGEITTVQRKKTEAKTVDLVMENKRNSIRYRHNIWQDNVGKNQTTKDKIAFQHPAIFPEQLAEDLLIGSNPKLVCPFMGGVALQKMALLNNTTLISIKKFQRILRYSQLSRISGSKPIPI